MNWLLKILDAAGVNVAKVDANGNILTRGPQTLGQEGFSAVVGRNDDGTVVAGGRTNRVYATEGQSLQVAVKQLLWDDTFNATAQNTAKYRFAATTMTGAMAAGALTLNSGAITTINTNCALQTFKSFPLFAKAELRGNLSGYLTTAPQANMVIEFGFFTATIPGAAAPADGVFFRYDATGVLKGVISFNGTEATTAALTAPSANVNHDFLIVCQTNTVCFYIDNVLVGVVLPGTANGQPMMMASQPFTMRQYIGGSAPASGTSLKVTDLFVTMIGIDPARPWSHVKAGLGHMASQGQNGGAMGSTESYANSAAAGAGAALTNTTALVTGLGGQAGIQPTLAAGTDGIVFSFQNPQGGVNQTPRNLVITGINLQGLVTAAFTGGPVLFAYSLAYGHTAVSLATTETGSFTSPTTKAPRRIALGYETYVVTAPVGTVGQGLRINFQNPIVVAPGEFVQLVAKNFGTVTSAGVIVILANFDAYFE